MSTPQAPPIGAIAWRDLTVTNAEGIRDFYCQVVGWTATAHPMGEYEDYVIHSADNATPVAGICHARGVNTKIPPQWLMYVHVANVDESAHKCVELGGRVIDGPREMGSLRFCVIQDPAGAIMAIIA